MTITQRQPQLQTTNDDNPETATTTNDDNQETATTTNDDNPETATTTNNDNPEPANVKACHANLKQNEAQSALVESTNKGVN